MFEDSVAVQHSIALRNSMWYCLTEDRYSLTAMWAANFVAFTLPGCLWRAGNCCYGSWQLLSFEQLILMASSSLQTITDMGKTLEFQDGPSIRNVRFQLLQAYYFLNVSWSGIAGYWIAEREAIVFMSGALCFTHCRGMFFALSWLLAGHQCCTFCALVWVLPAAAAAAAVKW